MANPRYVCPVDDARPYGVHRYDVYGLKIDRRLTLFGHRALNAWLQLEFDPGIVSYCERPLRAPGALPARRIDFWAKANDTERLLILLRTSERQWTTMPPRWFAAFEVWAAKSRMQVCLVEPEEAATGEVLRRNQATILHHVAAGHAFVSERMKQHVLDSSERGGSLLELESRLFPQDPVLARTVAFMLVLDGRLRCPTLALELIGRHTLLVRG
ncbi:hypothetical protein [Paraburkholderia sp. MM5384-R2]|uniref:hypothetical protein n=1 Tax=Paraburkholderia sp. MM5384-R2 TaxID=2723097 RepID=UPI0016147906|nr:hypothetical protein [Paraburkholderia sp. MM5384-R2]MBB5498731.1 hypothetical protein [Paraburkholderia sp. MM5384-R2]